MTIEMGEAVENLVKDLNNKDGTLSKQVKGVIFTGTGKAFSSGGDLKFLLARARDTPENNTSIMKQFYDRFLSIRRIPVPTIACINGPAIGAGLCFSLACDIRVVAQDATVGFTFTKLHLSPGMGCTYYLPKLGKYVLGRNEF
jgi:enoyl-CoA hydratase/carnithine racemase